MSNQEIINVCTENLRKTKKFGEFLEFTDKLLNDVFGNGPESILRNREFNVKFIENKIKPIYNFIYENRFVCSEFDLKIKLKNICDIHVFKQIISSGLSKYSDIISEINKSLVLKDINIFEGKDITDFVRNTLIRKNGKKIDSVNKILYMPLKSFIEACHEYSMCNLKTIKTMIEDYVENFESAIADNDGVDIAVELTQDYKEVYEHIDEIFIIDDSDFKLLKFPKFVPYLNF